MRSNKQMLSPEDIPVCSHRSSFSPLPVPIITHYSLPLHQKKQQMVMGGYSKQLSLPNGSIVSPVPLGGTDGVKVVIVNGRQHLLQPQHQQQKTLTLQNGGVNNTNTANFPPISNNKQHIHHHHLAQSTPNHDYSKALIKQNLSRPEPSPSSASGCESGAESGEGGVEGGTDSPHSLEQSWRECMTGGLTLMLFSCLTMSLAATILLVFHKYGSFPLAITCIFSSTLQLFSGFGCSFYAHRRHPWNPNRCLHRLCECMCITCGVLAVLMIVLISVALSQNTSEYDYVESGPIERHIYAKKELFKNCGGDCEAYWIMLVLLCCGYVTSMVLLVYLVNILHTISHLLTHRSIRHVRSGSCYSSDISSTAARSREPSMQPLVAHNHNNVSNTCTL
ncbi:uncharacterized protein LOC142357723 [Convolutriloba macropyga]|uniref:uncharacterized protein LOC142357723 n=1 Tax=Convolutriloba macropyga TaxID=536237 RepID=UPI003F5284AE